MPLAFDSGQQVRKKTNLLKVMTSHMKMSLLLNIFRNSVLHQTRANISRKLSVLGRPILNLYFKRDIHFLLIKF